MPARLDKLPGEIAEFHEKAAVVGDIREQSQRLSGWLNQIVALAHEGDTERASALTMDQAPTGGGRTRCSDQSPRRSADAAMKLGAE